MSLSAKAVGGISADRLAGRVGSALAGSTAFAHLASAIYGGHAMSMTMAHLVMAMACLPCVLCLWHRPTVRAWTGAATAALTMLVVHVWMLSPAQVATSGHHRTLHGDHVDAISGSAMLLMVLEVGTAAWVLTVARTEQEVLA